MLNYFNFKKFNKDYLITNDFGRFAFLSDSQFKEFISKENVEDADKREELINKYFLYEDSSIFFDDKAIHNLRNSKNYLFGSTQLQIFVVTTSCNLNCVYCQAQSGECKPNGFMTKEIAKKSVDIALQSPTRNLDFEFQGGEPLLNFDIIKYIVEYSESTKINRNINYSIVTNLTLITDEMIEFIKKYNINISTSLDGNEILHNKNRPFINGGDTFSKVKEKIQCLKKEGIMIGAIQTTTKESLNYYKEIIDTYIMLGFDNLFIRPLTPLGNATENWNEIGYTSEEFITFYIKSLEYIFEKNKNGIAMREGHTSIFLSKILNGISQNYMELRSPCGASIGQIAYYYNGNIYTCDEGRMLAEMGDESFCLGTVFDNEYNSLMDCTKCKAVCSASILESLPSCSDCVYQQFCGVCPIVNYSTNKDIYEKSPNGYKCSIYRGMLDFVFDNIKKYCIENEGDFWGIQI